MNGIDQPETWRGRVVQILRRESKKSAILGFLAVVLLVLCGRLLLRAKSPAMARAAEPPMILTDNLSSAGTAMPESAGTSLQEWARQPITPISRNLFSVPLDYYPDTAARGANNSNTPSGFWPGIAKSMSAQADQQEQRRVLVENVKAQAQALKLQSTVMSARPRAMVNDQLVREGSMIAGFRILKIEARRIVVERENVRLEIAMN